MKACPCCSGKDFEVCCEPLIQGQPAPTALALMRSRFSAYAIGEARYILNSTHAKTRQQHKLSNIEAWAAENQWDQLEIISTEHGNRNDQRGIVEFKAFYTDSGGKPQIHHERSSFLKEGDHWFYVDGSFNPSPVDLQKKVSRNDPCPCGSGKKFKKCCA